MKYLLIIICMLAGLSFCGAQPSNPVTKEDLLKKSRSQKTTGFVLLGVGATCIAIAAPGDVSLDIAPVLIIGGGAAILGSIPLFIASGKNKRKAMSMSASIGVEAMPAIARTEILKNYYPAVSIKLKL